MEFTYADFETKSEVPIDYGAKNYAAGEEADIVMLGHVTGETATANVWLPGQPLLPIHTKPQDHIFYFHNAQFDWHIWNTIGVTKYGFTPMPLHVLRDSMALCGRYNIYLDLQRACDIMGTPIRKDRRGKMLIKKICCPPYQYTDQDMRDFVQYCKDDVMSMRGLVNALPAMWLSPLEEKIWQTTVAMNFRGLPIDTESVDRILEVTKVYQEEHAMRLPGMTHGLITAITQTTRIKSFCHSEGVMIPNMQKDTVTAWLDNKELPEVVRELLIMRQELGRSSIAKYKMIANIAHNGWVYDNSVYYGAGTGRWAGRGFQMHNLPRAKVKDPEAEIEKFYDLSILEGNPVKSAQALIRPMICAKENEKLIVSDYAGIENRLLAWVVGAEDITEIHRSGKCEYKAMATDLYGIPYTDINDDQRFRGKVLVLGCGYGLGKIGFVGNAARWGWEISEDDANFLVQKYRHKYHKVVSFWYSAKDAAVAAISNPGRIFEVHKCRFRRVTDKTGRVWLQITLPSGRALYYMHPEIRDDRYGALVTHMGVNPYSKKWDRLKLIPGRIVENIIQALARDILAHGKLMLQGRGFPINGSVHDEIISVAHKTDHNTLDIFNQFMCELPEWATGLPLKAEGFIAKRYRKG